MVSSTLFLLLILFSYYRLLRFLHILQQDAYLPKRYLEWLWRHKAIDLRLSSGLMLCYFWGSSLIALPLLILFICLEPDPRYCAKLPLVMTARAKEIHRTALSITSITCIIFLFGFSSSYHLVGTIATIQLLPLILFLATLFLIPWEKRRQNAFSKEASNKMQAIAPFTIGITGSYGKTSTKDLLGKLLRLTLGSTYWPPRGVNTKMGIARSIREEMGRWTQYAVIEMAAYGKGSIARLCRFTPPNAAILTTIGTAHLERFGSRKCIKATKAELVEALSPGSILVCNGDDQLVREVASDHPELEILYYGFSGDDLICRITHWDIIESDNKIFTQFSMDLDGKNLKGKTPLLGATALSNLAAAVTMAWRLGADPELTIAALAHIPAVNNRLQAEKSTGITYLHDAYNSNPKGFSSALQVLHKIRAERRLLMTPGMIELGSDHHTAHHAIAQQAAQVCDQILLVGANAEQLAIALRDLNFPEEKTHFFATRDHALNTLKQLQQEGDAILIENDLPDLYEEKIRF